MKISIIIPCYNEESSIQQLLESVINVEYKNKEIIIVDDASSDNTLQIIESKFSNKLNIIKILKHIKNKGKGACIRTAQKEVTGDIVIIQDADLEYDPNEIPSLIEPLIMKKADVVYGSRFVGDKPKRKIYFLNKLGNIFLTFLSNLLSNLDLTDMETGYKIILNEKFKQIKINENRFGFEPEITAKLSRLKCRFYEMGISYHGRTYEEGKKIGYKDGIRAIYCILRYNLFK